MRLPNRTHIVFFIFFILLKFSDAISQQNNSIEFFLNQAETNSPLLSDFKNQMLSAKIDSLKLRSSFGFIVSGEGSGFYGPTLKGWGYDNAINNGQTLSAGVRVSKEIISQDNLESRLKSFKYTVAQLSAQANISASTLKKQITDQYIATYASEQQMIIAKETIELLSQEDSVLLKLARAGVFKQTDYLNFKVNLQQNELALEQRLSEWQSNFYLLNYLCGIPDTTLYQLETPTRIFSTFKNFDESIYADSYQADSIKLRNDAEIINYSFKPKISFFSDGGYQSSFVSKPYKNFGISAGINVSIPIYNGHQREMQIKQNRIQLDTRKQYFEQARNQYNVQLFQIQTQLKQYRQMLEMAGKQIVFARTLTEANAKQLPTGDVRMVDFIMSMNNLNNLRSNIIQYNTMIYNLQNRLQYLILQ